MKTTLPEPPLYHIELSLQCTQDEISALIRLMDGVMYTRYEYSGPLLGDHLTSRIIHQLKKYEHKEYQVCFKFDSLPEGFRVQTIKAESQEKALEVFKKDNPLARILGVNQR